MSLLLEGRIFRNQLADEDFAGRTLEEVKREYFARYRASVAAFDLCVICVRHEDLELTYREVVISLRSCRRR